MKGDSMEKKISPSDLRTQAQSLIAAGKMPKLEELLGAVASTREKYKGPLEAAKKENLKQSSGLKDLSGKQE